MTFSTAVRRWLRDDGDVYRCRNCRTALEAGEFVLDSDTAGSTEWRCPSCDSIEMVEYTTA